MWACEGGNDETVRLLLDAGADIHAVSSERETAWNIARRNGHHEIARMLKDLGAADDFVCRDLHAAILWNRPDAVKSLIETGADLEAVNTDQMTPLMTASYQWGNTEIIAALLDAGADLDRVLESYTDEIPLSALGYSILAGHTDADNEYWSSQETPLFGNVCWGTAELVALFIERGADVNARNTRGVTPLMRVVFAHDRDQEQQALIVEQLIAAGADVNARDNKGHSVLRHAGINAMKRILTEAGAIR